MCEHVLHSQIILFEILALFETESSKNRIVESAM